MPHKPPLKVVHINRHVLAQNIKTGSHDPVVTARRKYGKGYMRSNRINILDAAGNVAATILCDVARPLNCGARCYIETTNRIVNAENPEETL